MVALQKALDGASVKHNTIANNIANINTPGYKRKEVSFEKELKAALDKGNRLRLVRTNQDHIQQYPNLMEIKPNIVENKSQSMRPDQNNVDIDQEMTKMVANIIYFNTSVAQLNKRTALLKHIITEGRR